MATKKQKGPLAEAAGVGGRPISRAYFRLIVRFPLTPIEDDRHLTEATDLADELIDRADLLPDEEKYLDVLCGLIEAYEDEHYPIPDVSAGRMLRHLIEHRGVTQQAVARETGIANSTITALIKEVRQMTRKHIETFALYFHVEPAVFLPGNAAVVGGPKAGPLTG